MQDTNMPTPESMHLWQIHVLSCSVCGAAKDFSTLCQAGQNFWKPPEIPTFTPPAPPTPSTSSAPQAPSPTSLVLGPDDLSRLALQVSERICVRTSTGASIAVPMEKTSKLVSFSTAPGVILRMPERDIAIYGEMKDVILRISQVTEVIGAHLLFRAEMNRAAPNASAKDISTTALDVRRRTGLPIEPLDQVYCAFQDLTARVLRLGDTMGRLMAVDAETRRVIRSLRLLGIRMRGDLERSGQGELAIDDTSRETVSEARKVAIDLQGEIERRVGT